MPRNEREWIQYQNEMAKWVRYIVKLGDGSITTSGGTTISGLDEMPGRVASERSLNMSTVGNKDSVQSAAALSASDAGGTATITVAAHNLVTPSGTISYNGGSITGLAFSTQYFVYADDPTYAGGAVTYQSTTTKTDIAGNVGRYYVGYITTGVQGLAGNISNIVKGTNTTITTSSAHGFTTGATVTLADIVDDGPDGDLEAALNGNSYTLTVGTTTQFSVGEDTSSKTNVYVSGGTATQTAGAPTGEEGGGGGSLP